MKKIKVKIKAEELRRKLNIKDGKDGRDGKDGKDGKNAQPPVIDEDKIAFKASNRALEALKSQIPTIEQFQNELPSQGDLLRDGLERLKGSERLNRDAILGLDDYEEISRLARQPKTITGGGSPAGALRMDGLNSPMADISWASFKITSLGTPTADYDAATKKYVDDSVLAEDFWDRTGTTISPNTAGDSLNMGTGNVLATNGTFQTTSTQSITDFDNFQAFNVTLRQIKDTAGALRADFQATTLYDTEAALALNWNARRLYASDGTDIVLDWNTAGLAQFGNSNLTTTGLGSFGQLYANAGTVISPPASASGAIQYHATDYLYPADAVYSHYIRVYAYISTSAGRVYSSTYAQSAVVQNAITGTTYRIQWTWTAVPGASGYLVFKQDDYNGFAYDWYIDTVATSAIDDGGDIFFAGVNGSLPGNVAATFADDVYVNAYLFPSFIRQGTYTEDGTSKMIIGDTIKADGINVLTSAGFQRGGSKILDLVGSNLLLGNLAGNLTMTGGNNLLIGSYSGSQITDGNYNTFIGQYAGYGVTGGDFLTGIGWSTLNATTTGQYSAAFGYKAGYSCTGSSSVFLGPFAGSYETAGNALYIDNQDRTNLATGKTNALIYGTFNATVASQQLTVNAGTLNFNAGVNTDLTINFTGTTNSGQALWMEDEDYFKWMDDLLMNSAEKIQFRDTGIFLVSNDDGVLDIDSDTRIDFNINTTAQINLTDGKLAPTTTNDIDLGDTTHFYKDSFLGRVYLEDTSTYFDNNGGDIDVYTAANKTLELQTVVYEDLQFPISSAKVPAANYPAWETFTANTSEYSFAVNDYIDAPAQEVPHQWVEGTAGHPHLHITLKGAQGTGSDKYAKFSLQFALADSTQASLDDWTEPAALTGELTIPTGSAALQAFYLDMGDLTLTGYKVGTQIKVRIKRIASTGGGGTNEYSGSIFITQCGIHFETNTLGSRNETSK